MQAYEGGAVPEIRTLKALRLSNFQDCSHHQFGYTAYKMGGFSSPHNFEVLCRYFGMKKHTSKKIIVRWACRHSRISYKTIYRPYFVDLRCYTENPVMEHFTIYGVIATIFYPPTLLFFFFNNLYIFI